jgi:parallel beta-helix repeat protein
MKTNSFPFWVLAVCGLFASVLLTFAQGPLTPPGAPAPLFKTLTQVEPRTPISFVPTNLTVSGSYYLTTNLTQTSSSSGILIGTNDVTIDLNGFALIGTNGTADGITRGGTGRTNICIGNGIVRNWSIGVSMLGAGSCRLERLIVSGNSSNGISLVGRSVISECSILDNGGHGIAATGTSLGPVIRSSQFDGNALDGIRVQADALVIGNYCRGTGSTGLGNAAIRVTANRNRVDGNHILDYDNGIVVSGSGNFIFRNTTVGVVTNYVIAAGNSFGPTNTVSGVVTNHPWANFDL